jgi:Zn-dependent protease/CBS domain-containing protein
MPGSVSIGRIGGVPIRLHFTFLLVLPFLAYGFSRAFVLFRESAAVAGIPPELVRGPPLAWGAALALSLFASVLVHELAHSFYAIRKGGQVRDITLLMIGGVSNITEAPHGHRHEGMMAFVGPLASLALAALFWSAHLALGAAGASLVSLRFALVYLGAMNLALGVFNLLPAFPMDGGRILRAALSSRLGPVRATTIAATLGKAIALLFLGVGLFGGNFILAIVAIFVWIGAEAEVRQVRARSVLERLRVADFVRPAPAPLPSSATVAEAADRMRGERRAALVAMDGAHLLGVVSLEDLERPARGRGEAVLAELVRAAPQVSLGASAWDAFRLVVERRLPLLPVVEDGRVVGILERDGLVAVLAPRRSERGQVTAPRERTV